MLLRLTREPAGLLGKRFTDVHWTHILSRFDWPRGFFCSLSTGFIRDNGLWLLPGYFRPA